MKRIKRIFAVILLIIVAAVLGYTVSTCNRAVSDSDKQVAVNYEKS